MLPQPRPNYLAGYPPHLVESVEKAIASGRFGPWLQQRYPELHDVRSDGALYDYVQALRSQYLRNAPPISRVSYDNSVQWVHKALGIHATIRRAHGGKLKAKREIHVARLFRDLPAAFLRMIVVHELAHLKEAEHDKAFYQLCQHMEPDYFQLEFDLRAYLSYRDGSGEPLWPTGATSRAADGQPGLLRSTVKMSQI